MTVFDEEYKKAVRERSDAFMKHVATLIAEENVKEFESIESEKSGAEIPSELDDKMKKIIQGFEKQEKKRLWRKRYKTAGKIAAVVVLCLIAVSTVLAVSVDAFRVRVMDFFLKDHGEYMDLKIVETGFLPDEVRNRLSDHWKDVFYPSVLPPGYTLADAYDLGENRTLLFADKKENVISLSYGSNDEGKLMVDSENSKVGKTEVNENPAIYLIKEERIILHWNQNGFDFSMIVDLPLKQAVEIAENIRYVDLK